jgi:hypothetical protein
METRHLFRNLVRRPSSGRPRSLVRFRRGVRLLLEEIEPKIVPTIAITPLTNLAPETVSSQFTAGLSTMIQLTDGDILVEGGGVEVIDPTTERVTNQWFLIKPDAGGNYLDGTWSAAGSMDIPRLYFGSNVFPDGDVFVKATGRWRTLACPNTTPACWSCPTVRFCFQSTTAPRCGIFRKTVRRTIPGGRPSVGS